MTETLKSDFNIVDKALRAGPPSSELKPITEIIHGKAVTDPYRWLEGDSEGKMTIEVASWTDAQNAYTRSILDNLPGRSVLENTLRPLMEIDMVSSPELRGNRYFYRRRTGKQNQAVIYYRETPFGEARVLIDPNILDDKNLWTVAWFSPSHDGKLLAYGMHYAGDENYTLYLIDVETGKDLPDKIFGKVIASGWLPDGSGFLYSKLADVNNPYSRQIKFHRLGDKTENDAVIFEQYKEGPLATTRGPFAYLSWDGRWMFLGYSTGTRTNDVWLIDFDRWRNTGEVLRQDLIVGDNAQSFGNFHKDHLYLFTTLNAPNGKVIKIPLDNPQKDNWQEIIPTKENTVVKRIATSKNYLVIEYEVNATTELTKFDFDGKIIGNLDLPGIGTAEISAGEDSNEAFITFTSFNHPTSIFRMDLNTGYRQLWDRPKIPIDPETVQVSQVWYTSKDGTLISMFLVHAKGLKLDGSNPTILYGYGGFNISETPTFIPTLFQWFEAGGVYAVPNLRGGGEYGDAWHQAGMLDKKENVFDDCIAAAEWLINNGYTNPNRLAMKGRSNGGLLAGAMITKRPDLFAAIACWVPLLDMLRYHKFLMAKYWVPEYGSADDPQQFKYLAAYSPYHQVSKTRHFPSVFFATGENDKRVHPLHARKMAALIQAGNCSPASEKPVLLWVNRDTGHGQGAPLDIKLREIVDERLFLMWQLGMLPH